MRIMYFKSTFIMRTAKEWNSLPEFLFLETYKIQSQANKEPFGLACYILDHTFVV